jgi:hypothetical protein
MAFDRLTRRHFFYGSLLAGAVPAGGFGSTPSLKALGYKSPNEKLNIASIGAGGKAASDIRGCSPTENIVALCDVDDKQAAAIYKQFEKAPKYKDFRKMLDKEGNGIDAVIVTIPDHMHATAAIHCMERGKHVYTQKPLVRTIKEARMMVEAANKYKVATQMGNQGYSNECTRQCADLAAGADLDPGGYAGTLDPGLGSVAGDRQPARVYLWQRRQSRSSLRPQLLPAIQLARVLRFRLRRPGRHGVPHSGRAQHGPATGRTDLRGMH